MYSYKNIVVLIKALNIPWSEESAVGCPKAVQSA